tara:strand:- start:183165 stop:183740 length:576 start_codon:yes stop_codon:yes gene_type:complete
MVKLTFDESPCDFKHTMSIFKEKYFLKKTGLVTTTTDFTSEIVNAVADIVFDIMPECDNFAFRSDISRNVLGLSMSDADYLNCFSILEYMVLYNVIILDRVDAGPFASDSKAYIKDALNWFTYVGGDADGLTRLIQTLKNPGIISVDLTLKEQSKDISRAVLDRHLHQDGVEVTALFAKVTPAQSIKILWQ